MPRIRHQTAQDASFRARYGVDHHALKYVPAGDGRPCVGSDRCPGEPLEDFPVRLCGVHAREVYEACSDLVTSQWDDAVRDYVAELHDTFKPPRAVKQPLAGWVYFIRFSDRVKVGYTTRPDERMHGLPHEEIIGIIPGTRADERAWHSLLADFHVVGEWFRADPQVLAMLAQVATA
jgi:hypothetical protein